MFKYEVSKKRYRTELEKIPSQTKYHVYHPYNENNKKEMIKQVKSQVDAKYSVIMNNNEETLILKRAPNLPIIEVLSTTECFDVIAEAHLLENHAGHEEMENILKKFFCFHTDLIKLFLKACNVCSPESEITVPAEFSVFCIITPILIHSDNGFTDVIIYIDAYTNYILLRPTYAKDHHVVAYELLKIFFDFGIPESLQTFNGNQYFQKLMDILIATDIFVKLPVVMPTNNLKLLNWAALNTRALLKVWTGTCNSLNWAIGLKEVQWQLNCARDSNLIKSRKLPTFLIRSPYNAHFGFLPNDKVMQITNKLEIMLSDYDQLKNVNKLRTFDRVCLKCGDKIYSMYYKICKICKQKCHFNCSVTNIVKSSADSLILESTCSSCAES